MSCKRTKLYLFSQGYALVGSVWVFFLSFQANHGKSI